MKIEFRDSHLHTNGKVQGVGSQEFDFLIDTGSARTTIPRLNCQALGLRYAGNEGIEGMFGKAYLPLFDGTVEIEGRQPFNIQILGIEKNMCLLGLDILSKYKIDINWLSSPRQAKASF